MLYSTAGKVQVGVYIDMKWTEKYKVIAPLMDVNNIASPSAQLSYMQDSANCQMEHDGPSYNELFEKGLAFILSRITISFYAPLSVHEVIESESWACPSRGATFNRCYRLTRGGDVIAEASSAWALLDTKNEKLCRVGDIEYKYGEDAPIEPEMPARFRIPAEADMSFVAEKIVGYAEADLNGHMTNTKYPDILCSYIGDMRGRRVSGMSVNFVSEAPLGQRLNVYAGEYDGVHYVRTIREDGKTNVEAAIVLCDI